MKVKERNSDSQEERIEKERNIQNLIGEKKTKLVRIEKEREKKVRRKARENDIKRREVK